MTQNHIVVSVFAVLCHLIAAAVDLLPKEFPTIMNH